MHSFALTERYLVLVTFPLVVNPLQLALGGRPFIENYRWKPELGTSSWSSIAAAASWSAPSRPSPASPSTTSTPSSAGSEIVIDMAAYEDAAIVDSLYIDRVRTDPPTGSALARPVRYRILPDRDDVIEEELSDVGAGATAGRLRGAEWPPLPFPLRGRRPPRRRCAGLYRPTGQARRRERRGDDLVRAGHIPGGAGLRSLTGARSKRGPGCPAVGRPRQSPAPPRSCSCWMRDARRGWPGPGPAPHPVRLPRPVLRLSGSGRRRLGCRRVGPACSSSKRRVGSLRVVQKAAMTRKAANRKAVFSASSWASS